MAQLYRLGWSLTHSVSLWQKMWILVNILKLKTLGLGLTVRWFRYIYIFFKLACLLDASGEFRYNFIIFSWGQIQTIGLVQCQLDKYLFSKPGTALHKSHDQGRHFGMNKKSQVPLLTFTFMERTMIPQRTLFYYVW